MSRYIRPRSDLAAAAAAVTKQPWKNRPCGNPPAAPANLGGTFDRAEGGRHHRIRAKLHWNRVTTDTAGFMVKVLHYVREMDYTTIDNPGEEDWLLSSRDVVPADDDERNLPFEKIHTVVKGIQGKVAYRYRVKVVIKAEQCDSAWSDYYVLGVPNADTPPPPYNVTVFDKSTDRLAYKYDAVTRPDDDDLYDDRINHFGAEISKTWGFGTIYDRDRGIKGQHGSFKIKPEDEGEVFYIRCWSVSPDKDKSQKIPARIDPGNSDPNAMPSPIRVGRGIDPGTVEKWHCRKSKIPGLGTTAGAERLLEDGASYAVADFPDLFAAIGYDYGGSGANFNVPDHQNRGSVGVGTNYAELGHDGLAEGARDWGHGPHQDHRHKHKHNHKHNHKHDAHSGHLQDQELSEHDTRGGHSGHGPEFGHQHQTGSFSTQGPSGTLDNIPSGGTRQAAGYGHSHNVQSFKVGVGDSHSHVAGAGDHQHSRHTGHGRHGPHDPHEYDDTDSSDRTGSTEYTGPLAAGPCDSDGNLRVIDESGAPSGKGHKHHPRIHSHYTIHT